MSTGSGGPLCGCNIETCNEVRAPAIGIGKPLDAHDSCMKLQQTSESLLKIEREGSEWRAALAVTRVGWDDLWAARNEFLHPREANFVAWAGVWERKADFLRGRYTAKRALATLDRGVALSSIEVEAGVFGQPVVRGAQIRNLQVSIAHSAGCAAALAFDEGHPMALDIEAHDDANTDVIGQECTVGERAAMARAGLERRQAMTALWTAKESLAKVLRTGLMAPLNFYAISSVEAVLGGVVCVYANFPQYHTTCVSRRSFVLAITLPRKSTLQFDELHQTLAEF
jgi:4'-phosphopantetheinyl transferase